MNSNLKLKKDIKFALYAFGYLAMLKVLEKLCFEEKYEVCDLIITALNENSHILKQFDYSLTILFGQIEIPMYKRISEADKWLCDNFPILYGNREKDYKQALSIIERNFSVKKV